MQNIAIIRVIALDGLFGIYYTIRHKFGPQHATRITTMTKIAIPPDLASMFTACEDAYEQAAREGYAENPAVIAAVTALKSAWRALHVANYNLMTAKGFFRVEFAAIRADRACREAREACIKLHAAIGQAALEHRLYNRCLTLASRHVA
jgi:hypothetical protein